MLLAPSVEVRNITEECPLRAGSIVVAHTGSRIVVGSVLACYVKVGTRHGWFSRVSTTTGLSYVSLKVFMHVSLRVVLSFITDWD